MKIFEYKGKDYYMLFASDLNDCKKMCDLWSECLKSNLNLCNKQYKELNKNVVCKKESIGFILKEKGKIK